MSVETIGLALQRVGDYDLVEKIAEGGMGTVYKGRRRGDALPVAVKVIPAHLAANPVFLKRFEKEYTAASSLDHPNIVKALDFGKEGNLPYLVMEYVEGESLGQKIERDGKLTEAESICIISQVGQGLHKAHKLGLIHRDVKPDNILLTADGVAKLTDLGLVKEMESDLNLTRTGRGLGTPHFMAPEQFRRAKDADARCDVYSMAATLYMMVTGELPFKACGPLDAWMKKINNELLSARQVNAEVSERIDWAIRRSMSSEPAQRASSCREFIEDLTGQSTRRIAGSATDFKKNDLWFLLFKDDEGVIHTVKGSTTGVRRSLRDGLLGDASNVRISRHKQGPFDGILKCPEFRDLLIEPTARPVAGALGLKNTPTKRTEPALVDSAGPADPFSSGTHTAQVLVRTATHSTTPTPQDAPMIRISDADAGSELAKLTALIVIAAAAGAAGYFLMPLLSSLRLF